MLKPDPCSIQSSQPSSQFDYSCLHTHPCDSCAFALNLLCTCTHNCSDQQSDRNSGPWFWLCNYSMTLPHQ